MNPKLKNYLLIGGYILVAITLLVLPADFFDEGPSLCLSQLLADQECPGCGMTRGIQHLIHFDFQAAWSYNKLSFIIFPVLAFIYARSIYRFYKRANQNPNNK